ncbi:MAG: histidine kinase [Treponema sp.]|jgi:two-component system sensor histidine kinase YesM|nr:histidine kinase [Treponema sp.]
MGNFFGLSRRLSFNIFLIVFLFLLIPVYVSFMLIKTSYENYIQQELSSRIGAGIKKGEDAFHAAFQRMIAISNFFVLDRELISLLADGDSSYWDRNKRFDGITNGLQVNNLVSLDNIRITMFDRYNRNYANWGLYFHDYSGIMGEEWVERSIAGKGLISWNLFAPSFVRQENEQYISLARSVLDPAYTGNRVATIIVSMNQKAINNILSLGDMNADFIRIGTRETLEDIFALGGANSIHREDLQRLLAETGKSGNLLCDLGNRRYLLSYYTLDSPGTFAGDLKVLYFTDYQRVSDSLSTLFRRINAGMVFFIAALTGIVGLISWSVARPIRVLDEQVRRYTQTREVGVFSAVRKDEIGDLSRTFQDMGERINALFERLRQESEIREQYRFQALRAQVNPHFLFNTLNTVRWMAAIRGADNIVDTINALSRILDYSMSRSGDMAALGEELDMIRSYAHIQNYRYGEDWEVKIEVDAGLLRYRIVKFILQPVVENSFVHAFKNRRHKKIITLDGRRESGGLVLFVRDNGAGMDREKLAELRDSLNREESGENRDSIQGRRTPGIGLLSVNRRIRACGDFGLDIESSPGRGTTVVFRLPLIEGDAEDEKTPGC